MNRKETRLLVENWRNLLSEGYVSQDEELLNEGIVKNLLTAIPFLLSAYTANVSNALTPEQVGDLAQSSLAGISDAKVDVSENGETLILKKGNKEYKYKIPNTRKFSGSKYDSYLLSQLGSDPRAFRAFLKGERHLPGSIGVEGESENLFLSKDIIGGKFEKDLTNKHDDLIKKISKRFAIESAEIFTTASGRTVLIGYDDTDQPLEYVNFDPDELEDLCNKVDKLSKRDGYENHARGLRSSLIKFQSGLPLPSFN